MGNLFFRVVRKASDVSTREKIIVFFHVCCNGFSQGLKSLYNTVVYMIKSFLSRGGHFWCVSRHFDCIYTASLSRLVKTYSMQLKRRDPHPKSPHRETDDHISLVKWLDCTDLSHEQFTRRNLDNLGRHVLATSLTNSNQFELVRDHLIKN